MWLHTCVRMDEKRDALKCVGVDLRGCVDVEEIWFVIEGVLMEVL